MLRALSVPKVVSLPLISHLFEMSRTCLCFFYFQCKRSQFPYIVNKMSCGTQVIVIGSLLEELNFSCSLAVIKRNVCETQWCPSTVNRKSCLLKQFESPQSAHRLQQLMGRQSPATQTATALVTFSRTGLVIFLEIVECVLATI